MLTLDNCRIYQKRAIGILILALCLFGEGLCAGDPLDVYPLLTDTLMGGYYVAARQICSDLDRTYPGHPAAYHARAIALYTFMIDMEDTVGRARFLRLEDSCAMACEAWPTLDQSESVIIKYLKGSSYSTRGLLLLHEHNILEGLRLLMAARGAFDSVIETQPDFYDAYLGRGAYRLAVARNAKDFQWLPIIPSEESGWQDLRLAAERSRFSRYSAMNAMAWFAIDDRNFTLADSLCQIGLKRFPASRGFLWPALSIQVKQNRWAEAEPIAQQLLDQYVRHPNNNGYETTALYWRLMLCADSLGRPDEAVQYALSGLETFRTEKSEERRKDKIAAMAERVAQVKSDFRYEKR